jgi:hypothetical protein
MGTVPYFKAMCQYDACGGPTEGAIGTRVSPEVSDRFCRSAPLDRAGLCSGSWYFQINPAGLNKRILGMLYVGFEKKI